MTFEEARAEFPVLERFAYLNAGTLGPLSRSTLAALEDRLRFDQSQGRGGKAWFESVLALRAAVREQLATLVVTTPDRIALTSSTTDACNIVASGLELGPGDEIVTTDSEHPGLLLPLNVSGAEVRVAEVAGRPTADALDRIMSSVTPRTKLIALSHVLWTTGQVMPVDELKRESGLPLLVDGAQSVGAIPVDVGDLDYYTVSCQKWLCGPERFRPEVDRTRRNVRPRGGCRALRLRLARDTVARGASGSARRRARLAPRPRGRDRRALSQRAARALRRGW